MKTIFVFLAEGFEEIEALTPVDVLRRAGLSVQTVSIMKEQVVAGAHGIPVLADVMFGEVHAEDAEMILLPGGLPGATNLDAHEGLAKMILDFAKAEKPLAAICAAPLVFGNRGLLEGKKATCYPGFEEKLIGAITTSEKVITDGIITTSKAAGTAMDFAFEIIKVLKSEEISDKVKNSIYFN